MRFHILSLITTVFTSIALAADLGISVQYLPITCDRKSKNGDKLSMHYVGELGDASRKQFDSSFERNQPFSFTLGKGEVIKGWDEGLVGMCVGERRRLMIPPEMGYGSGGSGSIPGGSTLIFETALLKIN
jgi:FKBP-type peptidyl-prolyl cis-trans isomerase